MQIRFRVKDLEHLFYPRRTKGTVSATLHLTIFTVFRLNIRIFGLPQRRPCKTLLSFFRNQVAIVANNFHNKRMEFFTAIEENRHAL